MQISFEQRIFHFKNPSGTSRGVLTEKNAWFLHLEMDGKLGLGECSIIPGLSPDFVSKEQYEAKLTELCSLVQSMDWKKYALLQEFELLEKVKSETAIYSLLATFPSILFGFEMALLNWQSGDLQRFFTNAFSRGESKIPINGLIWMGTPDFMHEQMTEKVNQGFNCIKMKVGAIDFEKEMELLTELRAQFSADEMILRVDANGAFTAEDAHDKLKRLHALGIHSIEQPIAPGQIELMAELCEENPLPIALDEELIGISSAEEKTALLSKIQPPYIILKPSLHGGILSCLEWITIAESLKIDWWMTSALESNVGLNCIAQFTAQFPINKHHGLGTGSLYTDNIESQLRVKNGFLSFQKN
ncbi:MAG: o-succinylbenzoate synthase [Crocinitomicaceae bacterium]